MSRPHRLALPLALVACLSLTACSDDTEPAAASSSPTSAASAESPASPESSEESSETSEESPTAEPTLDAIAEDFLARMRRGMGDRGTAHMEMRVTGPAATRSSGDMRYGDGGSEIRMTTRSKQLGPGGMEMVVLRDAAYMSIPGVTPPGKFVRVGKDDPRFEQLAGASLRMSPGESVKAFRAGLLSVDERGAQRLQGVPTTRYAVEVDTVRALQAQGGDAVPGMPDTMTYQVWLDQQDRMRRMSLAISGVGLVIDLSRWGQPVRIEAPAKRQLVEAPAGF